MKKEDFYLYLSVMFVGLISGILYMLRSLSTQRIDSKKKAIIYCINGLGSSMLFCWIIFEASTYFFNLPHSVALAFGGGGSWIGAEVISRLVLRFLEKKFDLKD